MGTTGVGVGTSGVGVGGRVGVGVGGVPVSQQNETWLMPVGPPWSVQISPDSRLGRGRCRRVDVQDVDAVAAGVACLHEDGVDAERRAPAEGVTVSGGDGDRPFGRHDRVTLIR